MIKRTSFMLVLLLLAAMPLTAVQGQDEPLRVAVVMPSTADDLAWSQALVDSLAAVQEALGGEDALVVDISENLWQVPDAIEAIGDYAAQGYDIVFAHGTQYGGPLFDLAPDYPDVSFAWGTASDTGEDQGLTNIFPYEARAEQGGYINGVIAALLTQTGVVGIVGPVPAGDALLYIDGFRVGVMEANSDMGLEVEVPVIYTGSFGDTAGAAEAARTLIAAGADILTGSAQQVPGVIEAIEEAGGLYMATQVDQAEGWPDTVLIAQVFDWNDVILDMIAQRQAGVTGGIAYELSLENGGMKMVLNEELAATLPVPEMLAALAGGLDIDPEAEGAMVEILQALLEAGTAEVVEGRIDVLERVEELQAEEAEEATPTPAS
ncbi:MAG: BMP family protein [Anaerolineae bacterium]|nr:BMP family protein [Anaerolineae bacterium]